MNPVQPSSATWLFVVHVWRRQTRFMASVRRVDDEQTRHFTSSRQLARYLSATCGDAGDEAPERTASLNPPGGEAK